jgi:alanine dehydrogenase
VLTFDAESLRRALDRTSLIEALAAMFRAGCEAPLRHHHGVAVPGGADATLLLMPAWLPGRYIGTKVVNVFPENGRLGLPAVTSVYLLFSGTTGALLATFDGAELTTRRTVAASSLAVRYLAREDASRLLIVGTGDLAQAVAEADIVSCATLSRTPLIQGGWLRPGTHLDLIGGFTPAMREADDAAIRRAQVFIDTDGARHEAGDIAGPLESGVLAPDAIAADLAALAGGRHPGRTDPDAITLFKSVGASSEDLAAAALAYERRLASDAA